MEWTPRYPFRYLNVQYTLDTHTFTLTREVGTKPHQAVLLRPLVPIRLIPNTALSLLVSTSKLPTSPASLPFLRPSSLVTPQHLIRARGSHHAPAQRTLIRQRICLNNHTPRPSGAMTQAHPPHILDITGIRSLKKTIDNQTASFISVVAH